MKISDRAAIEFGNAVARSGVADGVVVIRVEEPTGSRRYELDVVPSGQAVSGGLVVQSVGRIAIASDEASWAFLAGLFVDYEDRLWSRGFTFVDAPAGGAENTLLGQARQVVRDHVDPVVAEHAGRVYVDEVRDGVAFVRMEGACSGCAMVGSTFSGLVVEQLLARVPGLEKVVDASHGRESCG